MRYKIVSDSVNYGGSGPFDGRITKTNLSISEAIDIIRTYVPEKNIEIDKVYSSPEDKMGCYRRYKIVEDYTAQTVWENLSEQRRKVLLRDAGYEVEFD